MDICDSTSLYERAGDEEATRLVTRALEIMEDMIKQSSETPHKRTGDGLMASFASADAAYQAAMYLQRNGVESDLRIKIGFSFGRVFEVEGDQYGDAANVAARLTDFATSGEIIIEERSHVRLSREFGEGASLLLETTLKGKEEPSRLFRIQWRDDSHTLSPTIININPEKPKKAERTVSIEVVCAGYVHIVDSTSPDLRIGRARDNRVVIDENALAASGHHCTVFIAGSDVFISDFSGNGTYLDIPGHPIHRFHRGREQLAGGGRLGLGERPGKSVDTTVSFTVHEGA